MDDDLRKLLGAEGLLIEEEEPPTAVRRAARTGPPGRFLGMTAPQRFIIAVMIFLLTFILGSLFLIVAGKVVLPL